MKKNIGKEKTPFSSVIKSINMSDKDYWKMFEPASKFETGMNSDINIDVSVKFSGLNSVIYETKENGINCNLSELQRFFENLKRTIKMLDTTCGDRVKYQKIED